MAEQRLAQGPRFRLCLSRRKLPYIITIDKTYLTMNDFTGERDGYYENKKNLVPAEWKKKPRSGWPGKIMVAMGICMRGKTSLFFVPPKVKMDHQLFIDLILRPLFKKDVPVCILARKINKIFTWTVRSHTDARVFTCLQDRKIKFITKEEQPANGPDLSPMDYFANSNYKANCNWKEAKNMDQLVKAAKRDCKDIGLGDILRALKASPSRVDRMIEMSGYQIENTF